MRFNIEEARKLLNAADVLDDDYEDGGDPKWKQYLNMNDVWCWACADSQFVSDEQLPEVAELFWHYGWAGILYWVSEQRGGMRSEFVDNNRFIDFVKHEEQLRKEEPDSNKRAYKKIKYMLGE